MTANTTENPDPALNIPITQELVDKHGLTNEEYQSVKDILGREPNLTELGVFSVMWSEHCSYKNSRPLLKLFPTQKVDKEALGQVLVKAGEENAGVIDIGDGWAIAFKIESHNHPSAIEPFEGAATGVGGIIRDIFTMGARPVLLTNSLRFGALDDAHTRRLFRGVVHGISHYGNCMGIPNVGGDIYFDDCYKGNPLVNALCLGVLRHDEIKRGAATGVGNPVYYVGAATGRDGLGGASFASKDLTEESAADRPAVQKGDPFMEKLLLEACLEMMAIPDLVVGIQDMGAAGLTCSTCETASRGGSGIEIELDRVPQRETGMNSYEIMLSESQERMLVIVKKGREKELEAVFEKWDLHAACIGEVKEGDRMVVKHHGQTVVDIPAASLADNAPVYHREDKMPERVKRAQAWSVDVLPEPDKAVLEDALVKLLSHPTIAEKRWVWEQYDHMVMAGTLVAPGANAAVVRIRTGDEDKYVAIANDCNNRYCANNPNRGSQIAIAECLRNLACVGATPLGMTDNLNFGNPTRPESFYMLKESVEGLSEACRFFDLPVSGGNVSLYNETPEGSIDPTPVVSVAGIVQNIDAIPTRCAQRADQRILLLGDWPNELGASMYLSAVHDLKEGDAPEVDLGHELKLHDFLRASIQAGKITSVNDLSEGGLMVALSEMLFADEQVWGAEIAMDVDTGLRKDVLLFGESQGRVLLLCAPENESELLENAKKAGLQARALGQTVSEPKLRVTMGAEAIEWDTRKLHQVWSEAIPSQMHLHEA